MPIYEFSVIPNLQLRVSGDTDLTNEGGYYTDMGITIEADNLAGARAKFTAATGCVFGPLHEG